MRNQSRPPSGAGKILKSTGYGFFLFAALVVGTAAGWIGQSKVLVDMLKHGVLWKAPEQTFGSDTLTLLILGCDEDLSTGGKRVLKKQARSDMMLIAKLDFKHNMVTGVSIPRDTRCQLPGFKPQKINAYHNIAKKGHEAELTEKAVEFLLPGVRIDRVVTLDFDHFQELVNMVHGVPLTIEKRLKYTDKAGGLFIDLHPGFQILNGYDAMCFVRFRHGDTDFDRQKRQKQFLVAFKQQALKYFLNGPKVVDESAKVLGDALTDDEIGSLALFARSVPPERIEWGQVPVKEIRGSTDLRLDEDKIHDVLAQYRLIEAHDGGVSGSGGTR
jgi:LCP family protein required for cell wall assembly